MIDVASSREEFVARAVNHTVVPVRTALVSDDDTPVGAMTYSCLLYTSPSPRDRTRSRMPSSA